MKHFDHKATAEEAAEAPGAAPAPDALAHLAQCDMLDAGVVAWDAKGRCDFVNDRAVALLELEDYGLKRGDRRSDLFEHFVNRGVLDAARIEGLHGLYRSGEPFAFETTTPSGRHLLHKARPRNGGGHAIVSIDVSELRARELKSEEGRARAEKMERKLGVELARLNSEKARVEERQEELQRLSLVAAHAKDLIVITDPTYRVAWANEAFRRHNGLDLEMDLLGRSARDVLTGPESAPATLARIDEAVRSRQSVTIEMICHRRNGPPYWMEQEIIPVFNDRGEHTNFILVGRDVSERKRAEAEAAAARRFEEAKRTESRMLAEFNEWLQSSDTLDELFAVVSTFLGKLLPGSSGAVYTYPTTRDALHRACAWGAAAQIEEFEPSACWALRRGRPYFYGDNTIDICCDHVMATRTDGPPEHQYCLPIIAHGDTVGLLSVELGADAGQDTQKLVNFCAEHISLAIANVKMRDLLREQSTKDPLTGLYNRRYFLDYARRELARCAAQGREAALLSFDVDHFKRFNDTYGHEAGDTVLKALAELLQKTFRQADVPCRFGGEEFVVVMPGCGEERAIERAEQLRAAVEALQLRHSGETLRVTISIGVATTGEEASAIQDLLANADEALYAAKDAGRNRVQAAA
ncbi:MAG: diguanylate cyclase [Pikeienuella sp.]|uniref:diguanylate cyclase n=1 Tax=Pikeienuella sp. TaxID=2831957 RepID=UPI00391B0E2A